MPLIKLALVSFAILAHLATTIWFLPFLFFLPFKTRKLLVLVNQFYGKILIYLLNIHLRVKDPANYLQSKENFLIVSNHLSYLDVPLYYALKPACFVTSLDIKRTLFLGQITMLGGCLFVDRKSKKNLSSEIKELTEALKSKLSVMVFPEATSTNGESVLRFRRPLFQSAIDAQKRILPLTINYLFIDGKKVDQSSRDHLCWYGDMDFLPHFWQLMWRRHIVVEVTVGEAIDSVTKDSTQLAELSHQAVSASFKPFIHQ